MQVFLVAGGSPSWRNSGWGQALAAGDARLQLVSFVEFSKAARPTISAAGQMEPDYIPKAIEGSAQLVEGSSGQLYFIQYPPTEKETP